MTTKINNTHLKHAALICQAYGDFGRLELGILGAPCAVVQKYAQQWIAQLSSKWNIAYVDADHKKSQKVSSSASLLYYDKVSHWQLELKKGSTTFTNNALFNNQDLVLINGNHFKATKQIVIVYPGKSLENKLEKLTDVALILLADGMEVPNFIDNHVKDISVIALNDEAGIIGFLNEFLNRAIAPLYGLVLAGGKSIRMQIDKGCINYHGKTQRQYMFELLSPFCNEVFISGKSEGELNVIEDTFIGLGPYGGILSAMQKNPNAAWLTVACDLPYLSAKTLNYLAERRNPSKMATAFLDSDSKFPEPLITIWEPRAYPVLLQFLSKGYSCPRKVLINSDIELLTAPDVTEFRNINFPEERDEAFNYFNAIAVAGSQ